jgi:hypothetical protein
MLTILMPSIFNTSWKWMSFSYLKQLSTYSIGAYFELVLILDWYKKIRKREEIGLNELFFNSEGR